jgi:acyl-CoA synthetase (AMP-forming)/AMP-acid ligase II
MTAGRATAAEAVARLDRTDAGVTFGPAARAAHVPYALLGEMARGNAEHLRGLGVRRGDRVLVSLASDLEHVVALLALLAMGAVPVSVKPRRGPVDAYAAALGRLCRRYGVRHAYRTLPPLEGVAAVGWSESARARGAGAVAAVGADDPAVVQFSSGSLGDPKAVPITHGALAANVAAILEVDGRTPDSVGHTFLPLSHDMGLVGGLLSNLVLQNPLRLTEVKTFLANPLDPFARERPAEKLAVPNFALGYLARYLASPAARRGAAGAAPFAGVRTIYCGAEPIRRETVAAFAAAAGERGLDPRALVFCYGLAEATLIVTARRFGSLDDSFAAAGAGRSVANVGAPVRDTEVVVGARGPGGAPEPAAPGAEGAVFVRGPGVFAGYLDDPASAHGGWFDTGDLGFLRDGELYVSGRAKDLIIVNGENLFPDDVEAVVARQPGVAECVVVPDDDRFYVHVVAERGAAPDPGGIAAAVGASFGAAPAAVVVGPRGSIERTTSGKPGRGAMLARLREGAAAGG